MIAEKLFHISDDGKFYISSKVKPNELLAIIEKEGPVSLEKDQQVYNWENVARYVIARLALRSIDFNVNFRLCDPEATDKERKALSKLQQYADRIREFNLSGVMLGISDRYAITEDGILWIPYNFEVEESTRFIDKEEINNK